MWCSNDGTRRQWPSSIMTRNFLVLATFVTLSFVRTVYNSVLVSVFHWDTERGDLGSVVPSILERTHEQVIFPNDTLLAISVPVEPSPRRYANGTHDNNEAMYESTTGDEGSRPYYSIKVPFRSISPPNSSFAYVFMIWNINPSQPSKYRPYLANMMIAATLFTQFHSSNDVVLMIRIDDRSREIRLGDDEERMLQGAGIRVLYLPIIRVNPAYAHINNFMNKFYAWNLTEYDRILFLDSDIIPLANLDYIFRREFPTVQHEGDSNITQPTQSQESKEHGKVLLKSTVVIAGYLQPANSGFFVLEPNREDCQRLEEIIYTRSPQGYRNFNETLGWGHVIVSPDQWETNRRSKRGRNWTFYTAHIDQGMLYHFSKYMKKELTNIFSRKVVNYAALPNGTIYVEDEWHVAEMSESPFYNQTTFHPYPWLIPSNCDRITARRPDPNWPGCVPPYNHYHHFTGGDKPWKKGPPPAHLWKEDYNRSTAPEVKSSNELWWRTLRELDQDGMITVGISNMGLPLDNLPT